MNNDTYRTLIPRGTPYTGFNSVLMDLRAGMPFRFHCSTEEGLNTILGNGPADWSSLQAVLGDLLQSADYDPGLPHLIDLSEVELQFAQEEFTSFGKFFGETFGIQVTSSVALVVRDNLQAKDCADLYRIACSLARAELFDDYQQALRWLMRKEFVASESVARGAVGSG